MSVVQKEDYAKWLSFFVRNGFAFEDESSFHSKHLGHPAGESILLKLEIGGELIGACALLPQRFEWQGRPLLGVQVVDGLIDREHRGKRLFASLLGEVVSSERNWFPGREHFIYSCPTSMASVRAHESAGLRSFGPLRRNQFVLRPEWIRKKRGALAATLASPLLALQSVWGLSRTARHYAFLEGTRPDPIPACAEAEPAVRGVHDVGFYEWRTHGIVSASEVLWFAVSTAKEEALGNVGVIRRDRRWQVISLPPAPKRQAVLPEFLAFVTRHRLADIVDVWQFGPRILDSGPWHPLRREAVGKLFLDTQNAPDLPSNPSYWGLTYLDSDW